ncbi:hypothetical protein Zmor_004967 [Zophobas morio]|uniref:Uncharacterized protein n=1 Tax=Zophobas morio TaxID=2755281 RepID=A0AA38IMA1_9CUCU|nr:hypothetical protein Zmor_004967 [Zophobas morio]
MRQRVQEKPAPKLNATTAKIAEGQPSLKTHKKCGKAGPGQQKSKRKGRRPWVGGPRMTIPLPAQYNMNHGAQVTSKVRRLVRFSAPEPCSIQIQFNGMSHIFATFLRVE